MPQAYGETLRLVGDVEGCVNFGVNPGPVHARRLAFLTQFRDDVIEPIPLQHAVKGLEGEFLPRVVQLGIKSKATLDCLVQTHGPNVQALIQQFSSGSGSARPPRVWGDD